MSRLGIELSDPHGKIKDVLRGKYASGDADKALEYETSALLRDATLTDGQVAATARRIYHRNREGGDA